MTRGFRDEDAPRREFPIVTIQDAKAIAETAKALLVRIGEREVWIPQSVIDDESEVFAVGHEGKLIIAGWFAEKEGIEP